MRSSGDGHSLKSCPGSHTEVSVGLLGMDEIFNPGAKPKYAIEEMLEERNELKDDWIDMDENRGG